MAKLEITYPLNPQDWLECYDVYYRVYRRTGTLVRAVLFLVPLALLIEQVVIQPSYAMGWVCIAVCLGAIAVILLNPGLERKSAERALERMRGRIYKLALFDDRVEISTVEQEGVESSGEEKSVLKLGEKGTYIVETERVFAVFSKAKSFAVPKSGLNVYETETLRDIAKVNGIKR